VNGEYQARVTVNLTKELASELHWYCSKYGVKQTEVIRRALDSYMRKQPSKFPKKSPDTPL